MKNIFFIVLISLSLSLYSQTDKKNSTEIDDKELKTEEAKDILAKAKERDKHYSYIVKFIQKEYVDKHEKNKEKYERSLDLAQKKLEIATTEDGKKNYTELVKKYKTELEIIKMWELYLKSYILSKESAIQKNDKLHVNALLLMRKIRNRYKELKAVPFPDPVGEFYKRYGKQLSEAQKKE